jgi:hypothetical protein
MNTIVLANESETMRVIVLAGDYKQFRRWCEDTGFPPYPFKYEDTTGRRWQAVYCDPQGYNLKGVKYDAYIKTGRWYENTTELIQIFHIEKCLRQKRANGLSAS